jgi:hypothetical protein
MRVAAPTIGVMLAAPRSKRQSPDLHLGLATFDEALDRRIRQAARRGPERCRVERIPLSSRPRAGRWRRRPVNTRDTRFRRRACSSRLASTRLTFVVTANALHRPEVLRTQTNADTAKDGTPVTRQPTEYAAVEIGDGCWLGVAARVIPGVRIAPGVHVAAGAVVTRSIDAPSVLGGAPARVLRTRP